MNVSDGYHLWSERYDRQMDDVFAVQDEIARAIVEKLKVKLVGSPDQPLVKRATNLEAYQLYLHGRFCFARRYKGMLERAVESFTRAISLDPGFAPAYAGLALALGPTGFWGIAPAGPLRAKALSAAERAVALDESLAEAHEALAVVHEFLDWNWGVSEREFTRALALDPRASETHAFFAQSLAIAGRVADAEREAQQAMTLDPLSPLVLFIASSAYAIGRQFAEAIRITKEALSLDPGSVPNEFILSLALTGVGRHQEAVEAAERVVRLVGRAPFILGPLGYARARAGHRDQARAVLSELLERSTHEPVSPAWIAVIYEGLGESDEALRTLEGGLNDWGAAYVIPLTNPAFDHTRTDPRFKKILERVGYTGPWASPPTPATT